MNVGLTSQEQKELESRLEKRQMQEFMKTYSNMVQFCFDSCVTNFTTKSLQSSEENCVNHCVTKQMKAVERAGLRFQEQNASMMASGLPGAGK